ncbi:MAG: hypothetical protein ACOC1O_00460 [bacterium]
MAIKDETIKTIYDLFRFNNLRVVYCPNDALGIQGPFKEVKEKEILSILNGEVEPQIMEEIIGMDILISGGDYEEFYNTQ